MLTKGIGNLEVNTILLNQTATVKHKYTGFAGDQFFDFGDSAFAKNDSCGVIELEIIHCHAPPTTSYRFEIMISNYLRESGDVFREQYGLN